MPARRKDVSEYAKAESNDLRIRLAQVGHVALRKEIAEEVREAFGYSKKTSWETIWLNVARTRINK